MYLAYDMLQLRTSSLANGLLIQRQKWKSGTDDIADLTEDQLADALRALEEHRKIEDPLIRRLLHDLESIATRVPGSFAQKLKLRAEIRGLVIRYGMPAFWITINPSDLRNPLVLILAGVQFSGDVFAAANSAIREATATSNPVTVAEFFHHVCKAIFDGLLASNTGYVGILGDVSNHYGVVETNGRGMLHLHALVWVRGNLGFRTLRKRVLEDATFAASMISYLEKIIIQGVDENVPLDPEVNLPPMPPSARDVQSDSDFHLRLSYDSNMVARRKQAHSKHHFATCFKYRANNPSKGSCRFSMPRDLVPFPRVDQLGVIHLARNHAWINPWNPALASCLRSNHDISWIPTVAKSLSLIYYITNYAAKDDVSPWQMVAKAALLKQSLEKAKLADHPTEADLRLREKGMNNFTLRCFNALAHDREVSGVQVASTLLHLPSYYTVNYNFVSVNLWWLRQYVRAMTHPQQPQTQSASGPFGEEACTYKVGDTAPVSLFNNYKWRGRDLACLTFFEYCMLVRMRDKQRATTTDFDFDSVHPRYTTHKQRLAQKPAHVATVTFKGLLTQFQTAEDSISGGHPATEAILNDVAEILLGLFVPWLDLSAILGQFSTQENIYSTVWAIMEPTLAPHNREFAANIELLRKSKEDCQADAKLRTSTRLDDDFFDRHIADLEQGSFDSENDDHGEDFQAQSEDFTAETLIAPYHTVRQAWGQELTITAHRIPALLQEAHKTIMFIDEMSMLDLTMLSVVNNHCMIARSLDRSSPDLFGGLPVVILMGDFFQFPPVRGPALWKEPRDGNDEDVNGQMIWHRFKQVIILDEQMRQSDDPSFYDLLTRARRATLTQRDVDRLNTKVIGSLLEPRMESATAIAKLNSVRHQINRIQIEHFAITRSQTICIFPAEHSRIKTTNPTKTRLRAEDLLQQPDQGTKVPFPGLFLYTRDMPALILTNICSRIGQVKGAIGTIVGVVLDPKGKSSRLSPENIQH